MNLNCHLIWSYSHCLNFQTVTNQNDVMTLSNYWTVYIHLVKEDHQWRRMMLCLHVANNETNNYQTWQPLFDSLKVTIPPINKEPVRKLYRITNVTNKAVSFIKRSNCSKCIKLLNIYELCHSSTSKEYPLSNENWTYKHWYE